MTEEAIGVCLLFGVLVMLVLLSIPIAFSLGIAAVASALYLDIPLLNLFNRMVTSLENFVIVACPFFVIMAQVMCDGGITNKLMKFCNLIVGRIPGGTALVNILVSMLFGGISGSSTADVSSIGSMLIPAMIKEGYDPDYSVAVTVTSSLEGVMIPPSQNMLYYAVAAASGISISTLLVCGYVPGVLLTLGLAIPAFIIARKRKYPVSSPLPIHLWPRVIAEALLGLGAIVIIVVGVTFGVCSATESAAIAAVYAIAIALLIYRSLSFKQFIAAFSSCIPIMAMSLAIIAASNAFSFVMSYLRVPALLAKFLLSLTSSPALIMLFLLALMILLGCFMDMGVLILVSTPILYPIAVGSLGVSPYQFGVILVFGFAIGLCTPPVGTSLFIGCKIAGIPVESSIKAFIPFYIVMFTLLLLFAYVPEISIGLPQLLGLL